MAHEQRIIVTEPLSREATDWLSDRASVQQIAVEDSGFNDALERASGLIVRTYTTVDRDMLDRAPNLRVVGRAGTGLDNIDVDACRERGIEVVHTPNANRQAVVEYVTSILATVLRPLPPPIDRGHTPADWAAARRSATAQRQMSECRLGILGLGAIGKRVAEVATAVGLGVQYHDIEEIPSAHRCGGVPVALDVLLHSSDVLTIHVDGRADNRHFLSTDQFNQLLPNVMLINTSRGFVIDSRALTAMLRTHPDSMAVLDVHEHEPIAADDPLLSVPNATLLPHAASRTAAAQLAMSWVVQDVWMAVERSP